MKTAMGLTDRDDEGVKKTDRADTTKRGIGMIIIMAILAAGGGRGVMIMAEAVVTRTVIITDHAIAIITTGKESNMKRGTGDSGFADFGMLWDGHTQKIKTASH